MKIDRLMRPRSIAVLGASEKPSLGRSMVEALLTLGFEGAVYPINPKYETVAGVACHPDLRSIGVPVDAVSFCIGAEASVRAMRDLADCGAGAGVIYGSGFAEQGEAGRAVQDEITGLAREAGIALCGPNCMGVLNPVHRSSTFFQPVRDPAGLAGHVGLVSQSGSVAATFLADLRRFGFSAVVSSGNEAVVDLANYVSYLALDPATRVIAVFAESVRRPDAFVAALQLAAAQDKPVIVLKVGKSERAMRQIQSHTGGLAGQARVFSEVLRAYKAIEVASLAEMTEQIAVCLGARRPQGRRMAVVTTSGGQAELILDLAAASHVELPPLPDRFRAEVEAGIGASIGGGNPLDAWGNDGSYLPQAFQLFSEHDLADSILFCGTDCLDATALGRPGRDVIYARNVANAATLSDKPHYYLTSRQGVISRAQVEVLSAAGVPVIGGTELGLRAVDRYAGWSMRSGVARRHGLCAEAAGERRSLLNEYEAKRLLADFGVPVSREFLATSADEAATAAARIGYPVVAKAVCRDLAHKSEHGLVLLDIADEPALRRAYAELARRAASAGATMDACLVQELVRGGLEVFAGVSRDPQFGLVLAFGLGGVAVEVLDDVSLRLLPIADGEAERMISELRGSRLLNEFRGRPALDVASVARCLYALSDFAMAHADCLHEIDLNPIIVQPEGRGCVAVDALVVKSI